MLKRDDIVESDKQPRRVTYFLVSMKINSIFTYQFFKIVHFFQSFYHSQMLIWLKILQIVWCASDGLNPKNIKKIL